MDFNKFEIRLQGRVLIFVLLIFLYILVAFNPSVVHKRVNYKIAKPNSSKALLYQSVIFTQH